MNIFPVLLFKLLVVTMSLESQSQNGILAQSDGSVRDQNSIVKARVLIKSDSVLWHVKCLDIYISEAGLIYWGNDFSRYLQNNDDKN